MTAYKIEYTWEYYNQITIVFVAGIKSSEELIILCDEIYEIYSPQFEELNFYFFQSSVNAIDYIYLRFIKRDHSEKAIVDTNCKGQLIDQKLIGRFSPPEHLKTYSTNKTVTA